MGKESIPTIKRVTIATGKGRAKQGKRASHSHAPS